MKVCVFRVGGYLEQPACHLRMGGWIQLLSNPPHLHATSISSRGDFLSSLPWKSWISSPLRLVAIKTSLLMLYFAHSSAFQFPIAKKLREVFHYSSHGGSGDKLARTRRQEKKVGPQMGGKSFSLQLMRSTSAELYLCIMEPSCLLHFYWADTNTARPEVKRGSRCLSLPGPCHFLHFPLHTHTVSCLHPKLPSSCVFA